VGRPIATPARRARSAVELVAFAVVLGLVVAAVVTAVVGIAVFAIQNALG